MKLSDILIANAIKIPLEAETKDGIIQEMISILSSIGKISDITKVLDSIIKREEIMSTGIGNGVAVPHGRTDAVKEPLVAFGITKKGVEFNSLDGKPVYLVFLLVAPEDDAVIHVKILARISRLIRNDFFRKSLMNVRTPEEVLKIIQNEEKQTNEIE